MKKNELLEFCATLLGLKSKLRIHGVEIKNFLSFRFLVKSIMENLILKLNFFSILRAQNFVNLVTFSLQKSAKIHRNQNSEPLNVLKWQILHF